MVGNLPLGQQDIQRNHDRACFEDAVVDDGEIGQVRAAQRDPVAGPDAAGDQCARHLSGRGVELRVRQAGRTVHHGFAVCELARAVLE